MNNYLKTIVGVLGAIGSALSVQYPGNHWSTPIIAIFTAALVYLVPNTPPTPKVQPPSSGANSTQPLPEVRQ